jgi:hypothetical protein
MEDSDVYACIVSSDIVISIFIPVAPTWSIGHPGNASFQFSFLILLTVGRTPWTGDQPVARPLPTQDNTNRINANIHALSGIRTHDLSVRASEDISCLRPRGHYDRQ